MGFSFWVRYRYSLQAYQNKGAKQLQITFDTKTDLDGAVIDKNGNDVNTEKGLGGSLQVCGLYAGFYGKPVRV